MLENNNLVEKEEIKALGLPNINSDSIVKATKGTGSMEKLLKKARDELGLLKTTTHNCNKVRWDVLIRVLNQVHKQADIFCYTPGRQFRSFTPSGPVFKQINRKQLYSLISRHKRKWHRLNRNFYKHN